MLRMFLEIYATYFLTIGKKGTLVLTTREGAHE